VPADIVATPRAGPASHAGAPGLPPRFPARVWAAVVTAFLVAYGFMFSYVHPAIDTRKCTMRFDDPLMALIPFNDALYLVTHELYYAFTGGAAVVLFATAVRRNHAPLLRWGLGLTVQAALRSATLLLVPLCRATQQPGTAPLAEWPLVEVGPFRFPFRTWATNDMMFSGHVGEFVLLSLATRHWPRPARLALVGFQIAQAYGLIATRGHYSIDILVAIPCALLADAAAVRLLRRGGADAGRPRPA
jgi:hypothetical protein